MEDQLESTALSKVKVFHILGKKFVKGGIKLSLFEISGINLPLCPKILPLFPKFVNETEKGFTKGTRQFHSISAG